MTESRRSLHKMHQDRISKLPSDILISIISRLTLREATATSILSTCWRHLHTYVTRLDFPPCSYSPDRKVRIERKPNYIRMVDHVLNTHRGTRIKEFGMAMSTHYKSDKFERWFEFALTKKSEKIHIDIYHKGQFLRLPNTILLDGLKCLKELSLSRIRMGDQEFELLVSNCLALECLTIKFPMELKNVSIVGLSKLKHLNLSFVWGVASIVIRDAISLVSLTCYELNTRCAVQLSNIPKLTKLDLKEEFNKLTCNFARMPSCIRDKLQLMQLSTCVASIYPLDSELLIELSVELVNMKHLELVRDMRHEPNFRFVCYVCRLVEACRSLEKLVIKMDDMWQSVGSRFLRIRILWKPSYKVLEKVMGNTYYNPQFKPYKLSLKYLEIIGYLGSQSELELAIDVVNSAGALEKFTVVPCDLSDTIREKALARAQHDFRLIRSVNFLVI